MTANDAGEDKSPSQKRDGQSGDGELTLACPECDSAGIRVLTVTDKNYSCRKCSARFDEPEEREVRAFGSTTPNADLPQKLLDPETEIVTDGGTYTPADAIPAEKVSDRKERTGYRAVCEKHGWSGGIVRESEGFARLDAQRHNRKKNHAGDEASVREVPAVKIAVGLRQVLSNGGLENE